MSATLLNGGKVALGNRVRTALNGLLLIKLYTNDPTITDASVAGDFTEAGFPGYAAQDWGLLTTPTLDGNNNSDAPGAAATFTCSGGGSPVDVYGYLIYDPDAAVAVWAERNPSGPVTLVNAGDTYTVTIDLFGGALPTPF